ncbi:putative mfs protein [Neofusicoccum parvum UCRNP2]|uniref:Putative mfs protein n=1 Tax=Botryosphaeria parva (strain UCR-NP2) TaxID=1287680 RepID=R1E795_BOTPV|nr:putative mfs protein [Neofusicoccum parvum UCRNP2]
MKEDPPITMASSPKAESAASLPGTPDAEPDPELEPTTTAALDAESSGLESAMRKLESNTAHNYGYPLWRKGLIVFATSWVTLAATFSSTSLFSAAGEIAAEFGSTAVDVNVSNAGVMLAMAFSSFIWGPIGMVQRGTATGFFLAGTVLGPPLGPLVAGIIVTYKSWRVILWLQAAMCGCGLIMSLIFIPYSRTLDAPTFRETSVSQMIGHFNPSHIFKLMIYPNVLFTDLACGLLSWSQYTLLSAPRHIITTRFHLTSPIISGLFYLSPAAGFLVGTLVGGRASDRTVRAWLARRRGVRVPQDRLRSGAPAFFLVVPASSLAYGWCLERGVGGLPLPVAMAFCTAAGLLAAFASLNTYCAEVMPRRRAAVIATKYCVQYCFAAAASGASVPMIDAIGVGATSTVSAVFVLVGGVLTLVTAKYGLNMQDWVDERLKKKKNADPEKQ